MIKPDWLRPVFRAGWQVSSFTLLGVMLSEAWQIYASHPLLALALLAASIAFGAAAGWYLPEVGGDR